MKRFPRKFNSNPEEYNRIFNDRQKRGLDEMDRKRWEALLKYYKGGKIIDLGCLDSLIPINAKTKFPEAEVWAIDHAEDAIKKMKIKYPGINYEVRNVYQTGFEDGFFDYAVAGELLEHLEQPQKVINEAFRILKLGGILAISAPWNETEEGDVDKEHHLWSLNFEDISAMCSAFAKNIKIGILETPEREEYHHPILLSFWAKI